MEEEVPHEHDKPQETLEEPKGSEVATEEELDEMTGGLNLVNRASCTTAQGAMNTVVSIGGV
jgi:hypothetical protein